MVRPAAALGQEEEPPLVVAGMMSGTSADGIDVAVLSVPAHPTLETVQRAHFFHYDFRPDQQQAIFQLFDTERTTARDVCQMNVLIGEWFAAAALAGIAEMGLSSDQVDLISSHGQTIFHCPPGGEGGGEGFAGGTACTLQIGEPAVIAERTSITTIGDFRVRDVAAGGHGAPLVSYVDALLFRHTEITRIVLNLGGIANVTVIPPDGDHRPVQAFDTGPANMVLDFLASTFSGGDLSHDVDGRMAGAGAPDGHLLAELLADPYFAAPPPKTTGRERYGAQFAQQVLSQAKSRGLSTEDTMATVTALTAETVASAVRASGASEVIAGGGGTKNPVLMAELATRLPGMQVTTHEAYGIPSQAKEAISFAILGAAGIRGEPNTLPSCTGAASAVVMGKIVPGQNYASLLRRVFAR
ncbi:MAG TPA: anhydro-N-acetylmuramic acid kinase [Chloroflexota bacterium]|nr:anhydro-N-acetylmuramic acid kinase [Chloroflexota bacterium]